MNAPSLADLKAATKRRLIASRQDSTRIPLYHPDQHRVGDCLMFDLAHYDMPRAPARGVPGDDDKSKAASTASPPAAATGKTEANVRATFKKIERQRRQEHEAAEKPR